jgi:uncharacterized membrane protein YdjX (TVP38/TMEM64 family)
MSSEPVVAKKKLPLLKILAALVVLGVVAGFGLRGVDWRGAIETGMGMIRSAGPMAFFTAMALLPALAVPASTFTLTAGPAFGEKLGMPAVVALSVAAVTFNLVFTYWLARRALRPWLEKLMKRLGYKLPDVAEGDLTDLAIIVRVTPGSPFFVQNYLLGLAGVPFGKYLLVSCIVQVIYTPAFVLFGDALLHGKGKMAFLAVSFFVLGVVITHWARKHYGKKKAAAKLSVES